MIGAKANTLAEAAVIDEVLPLIRRRRTAIDGGAHVGTQTVKMAAAFRTVLAFEPCADSFQSLSANCRNLPNVRLIPDALLNRYCSVQVFAPKGRTTLTARQVKPGAGSVRAVTIDSLDLQELDFVKLDLEGCEYYALVGGEHTIRECRPFLLIEMSDLGRRLGVPKGGVTKLLDGWGYRKVFERGVDAGFIHKADI